MPHPAKQQILAPSRLRLRHLQPLCLAILARKAGSGYDVRTALAAWPPFAGTPPDAPGIYRTLQAFARRGLLRARKQPPAKGPARVEYTLTPAGFHALATWQATLLDAHKELQALLELLQGARRAAPPPPRPPARKKTAPPAPRPPACKTAQPPPRPQARKSAPPPRGRTKKRRAPGASKRPATRKR